MYALTSTPARSGFRSAVRKGIAGAGLVALLVVPVLLLILLQRSAMMHVLGSGEKIPDITLQDIDSRTVSLSEATDKPTAIFFFSANCPHCQRQMPIVADAYSIFGRYIRFLAVSGSNREATRTLMDSNRTAPAMLLDEKGIATKAFGVSELPALFLVGRDQRIRRVLIGEHSRGVLESQLARLVNENKGLDAPPPGARDREGDQ